MSDWDETRKRRGKRAMLTPAPPKYKYRIMAKCPKCGQPYTFPTNIRGGDVYCPECNVIADVKKIL